MGGVDSSKKEWSGGRTAISGTGSGLIIVRTNTEGFLFT